MANTVSEYIDALLASERLGGQVAHHRLLPGFEPQFAEPRRPLPRVLRELLAARGLDRLYSHQAHALDLARSGRNVVVATPTASGKTLTYNLPVLEQCLADPASRALYLFPLKALAQDQLAAFKTLTAALPEGAHRPDAAIYDGDTTPHFRRKIRDNLPNVLLTNPDMLHLGMLPHHEKWADLFANLTHVVVDEVHTYRGVMGSHMALVFRRLLRVCRAWGANPTFIFCSATVGNPAELCEMLTGREVTAVTESGAGASPRHMVFLNPLDGTAQAVIMLLQAALARDLRTIVYAQSRKLTELIALWAQERSGQYKERISAYRAGFLPEERREIEGRMASGELLAVISTSALELGIDIGGLDLCILAGYPGSVMATLQRGGRVGRAGRESAVALVAGEDALDQHFMRHPEDFFCRAAESAVLNPFNPAIMHRHLECAAAEMEIKPGEPFLDEAPIRREVDNLVGRGRLFEVVTDRVQPGGGVESRVTGIVCPRKRPHRNVDLRGAGRSLHIEDADTHTEIGTVDQHRAFKETHPGAVYLHRGASWVVDDLDLETSTVLARQRRVSWYTRTRGSKSTEILEITGEKTVLGTRLHLGRLRVTEEITGYEKRSVRGGKMLGIIPLDLPPLVFETEGIWFLVPDEMRRRCEDNYLHFMGGIHALEHAAIGILPLLVLTDRNDLGGISTPFHAQTAGPAVFIYDGLPGGAGLTRQAFHKGEELFRATAQAVRGCECELGCPSCVHSPKCGSGNRPIDKAAALFLLDEILGGQAPPPAPLIPKPEEESMPLLNPGRFGVLDIETRRSADEVGGWNRCDKMGVSIAVLYDSGEDRYFDYEEHQIGELVEHLKLLDLTIGFNILRFDYKVLTGLSSFPFQTLPTLDLLVHIHQRLGYRVKLDNLAQATLNAAKSADGLQALKWWQEGRLDLITEYCRQDVAVTRDLYTHGRDNRHVFFTNKAGQKVRLPVDW
ncbi:DEAD/DEAH box helicase [Paucidesulfovibrio longus]|uniref:DEAD/DEAH box helicase n=1 Tax=Paucidesulfovibrio longus TaxID=889 RepID=UPI0003B4AF56|nr:DEAD/DEAH box helicase [Paucidesulfovibrio longus]